MTAPHPARVETPADTLRRAAAKVRAAFARAARAPWEMTWSEDGDGQWEIGDWDASGLNWSRYATSGEDDGTAEWIALASPAIAEPLAAWLNIEAQRYEVTAERMSEEWAAGEVQEATDFARVLLGSPVPEPDGEGTA